MSRVSRDWSRYAVALDLRLEGATFDQIANHFGVTRERARIMVIVGGRQLAFRVFKGVPRPLPAPIYEPAIERDWLIV